MKIENTRDNENIILKLCGIYTTAHYERPKNVPV